MNTKKISIWLALIVLIIIILGNMNKPNNTSLIQENTSMFEYEPGDYDFSLMQGELERTYLVYVPKTYNKSPTPLVFVFHGGGGNVEKTSKYLELNTKADKEGFIVIYPQGYGNKILGVMSGSWNAGECCRPSTNNNIDDVDFVKKIIEDINIKFNVNQKQIYATGLSNGGLMSYRLACDMSDTFAAIAPAGAHDAYDNCNPSRAVPVLHFHGKQDTCSYYEGGECGTCFIDFIKKVSGVTMEKHPWICSSVSDYIQEWRKMNECSKNTEVTYEKGEAQCIKYTECKDGADVILCSIANMGHAWPGIMDYAIDACERNPEGRICTIWKDGVGPLSEDIIANDMIWEFFKEHPMP